MRTVEISLRVVVDDDDCILGAAVPKGDDWRYIANSLLRAEREGVELGKSQVGIYRAAMKALGR